MKDFAENLKGVSMVVETCREFATCQYQFCMEPAKFVQTIKAGSQVMGSQNLCAAHCQELGAKALDAGMLLVGLRLPGE